MIEQRGKTTAESSSTCSLFNGACISTRVLPARDSSRSADWCDVFVISEDIVALSVGDVCGHGDERYETMVAIRQAIRDLAALALDPATILARANRIVRERFADLTATALVAFLDTRSAYATFANAGHPPPLLVTSGGAHYEIAPIADLPLGVEDDLTSLTHVVQTPPRTLLVLYTDGVTEHERLPLLGEAQLLDAASSAYWNPLSPTALAIQERMIPRGTNRDDAALLTAWLPRTPMRLPLQ